MSVSSIPVDLRNPGQVFACLGFMEVAEALIGPTMSEFDWSDAQAKFYLEAEGCEDPFSWTLEFLARCKVVAVTPPFPVASSVTPSSYPVKLVCGNEEVSVAHCADRETGRDTFRLWVPSNGISSANTVQLLLEAIRLDPAALRGAPFDFAAPLTRTFRLDWRHDYVPRNIGFSLNNHKKRIVPLGHPVVELVAALGLRYARPRRTSLRDDLSYEYAVSAGRLPAMLRRVSLGGGALPFTSRKFRIKLARAGNDSGKKSPRCITSITETTPRHA